MTWDAAVSYCRENQLELAAPLVHNAVWLQQTLQDKYGMDYYYINKICLFHKYIYHGSTTR